MSHRVKSFFIKKCFEFEVGMNVFYVSVSERNV